MRHEVFYLWEIEKAFAFEAAHYLPKVPAGHKCGRMHGHSYEVTVRLGADELRAGMLVDYADLAAVVEPLVAEILDHRVLNEVKGLENPTTEVLAEWFWDRLVIDANPWARLLDAVIVSEARTTKCTYRGPR